MRQNSRNVTSRHRVLSRIRQGLNRETSATNRQNKLEEHLQSHPRNCVPKRAKATGTEAVGMFIAMAKEAAAEIVPIKSSTDLPEALKIFIGKDHRPLLLADEAIFTSLDWQDVSTSVSMAKKDDLISLTSCIAGIAETGTLVLKSGPTSPTTLNFLPDIHCVLLRQEDIVGGYDDAWDLVRKQQLPRTVNLITGPSRSADIEQKIQMGAHGPKQLVIFLLQAANGVD